MGISRWRKYVRTIAIMIAIIAVIGLHGIWVHYFSTEKHNSIEQGTLDLQQWDVKNGKALTLDGQWQFYPSAFIVSDVSGTNGNVSNGGSMPTPQPIQVPGSWESILDTHVGFGSYRLTIELEAADEQVYALYIPSIQTASRVYINGQLAGGSGQPAVTPEAYNAFNTPYIVEASTDEDGVIDIIIEASNYVHYSLSGIEQAPQFGEQSVIVSRNQLSITMQQLVFVIILMHVVYAVHLYVMGIRNKYLLYLSLLFVIILLTLAGNGNKLIFNWLPLTYISDYKLKGALLALGGIVLLSCCIHRSASRLLLYTSRIWIALGVVLLGFTMRPSDIIPSYSQLLFPCYVISTAIISSIGVIGMIRARKEPIYNNAYIVLLLTALLSMVGWEYVQMFLGISTLFYPLDLIVALFCISSLIFNSYIGMTQENKHLVDRLQREEKLKDQFLANTSHELRNPLHGILNLSAAVLERSRPNLDKRSLQNLELVQAIGKRMNILLNDLLDISRLKEQGIQLTKKSVNLHSLTEKTIDTLKYLLVGKDLQLVNKVSPQLPFVLADENRLMQIMFNLLHNAIKFTDKGIITITAEVHSGAAHISIADTGRGIQPNMLQYVFSSYQQINEKQEETEYAGIGLGLSISKQLVELHGSELQVQSAVGRGSTFSFSLPLADGYEHAVVNATTNTAIITEPLITNDTDKQVEEGEVQASPIMASARQSEARVKIIVVDDELVNLKVLREVLNPDDEQLDICFTTSAYEVLERLAQQSWDLVISDVKMPEMSGIALTSLIRETYGPNELPVLLLTSRNKPYDIEAGLLAGANDYITKPVHAIELKARVRTLVRLRRSHQESMNLEAAWLQAQIKPHFVVNALNSIVALSTIDEQKMLELANEFSQYLRASYKTYNNHKLISLQQELDLVRSYLSIQKMRFGDALQIDWRVEEDIELLIPPLVVHSVVEHAVVYGALSRSQGGTVSIEITKQKMHIYFCVIDNVGGMSQERIEAIVHGRITSDRLDNNDSDSAYVWEKEDVGLYNSNLRLRQNYRTGLTIESTSKSGTRISFRIPNEI